MIVIPISTATNTADEVVLSDCEEDFPAIFTGPLPVSPGKAGTVFLKVLTVIYLFT
jgi:hypothetical protein